MSAERVLFLKLHLGRVVHLKLTPGMVSTFKTSTREGFPFESTPGKVLFLKQLMGKFPMDNYLGRRFPK